MIKNRTLEYLRSEAKRAGVKKLWLFGSCVEKNEEEAGDIDLAVEGLKKDKLLEFYGEILMSVAAMSRKNVDLVDMSDNVYIAPYILESGVVLYENRT